MPSYLLLTSACCRLQDPPLTEQGVREATERRPMAVALDPQPELVVLSTMRRATMTGLSAFEHLIGKVSCQALAL